VKNGRVDLIKMAADNLHCVGIRNVKPALCQEAARIILQDYLDRQKDVS
jgi:hypothetical protein